MTPITLENITGEEVWRVFGHRKQEGRIDFVYNTNTNSFVGVPRGVEHKDFMPDLSTDYPSLVPVQLRVSEKDGKRVVNRLIIGVSSFEEELSIKHTFTQLMEAYCRTLVGLTSDPNYEINFEGFEWSKAHTEQY